MFCNNCGKQIEDNQAYCTSCGARTGGNAATDRPSSTAYAPDRSIDQKRRKQTQALAVILAMLTTITMLLGWFSLKFSVSAGILGNFGLSQSSTSALKGEKTLSATLFGVADAIRGISNAAEELQSDLAYLGGGISAAVDALEKAAGIMGLVRIIMIAAICAMLVFTYMALTGKKTGALIGQIGGALAFLAALIFAISMGTLNSSVARMLNNLGALNYVRVNASGSIWVYATMALGVLDVLFIALRKKTIRGE